MKQLVRLLSALVSVLLASARTSSAALISVDLNTPGDALLTRDTDTNLEYLDVTASGQYSFEEILGGAGGFKALGFRPANSEEMLSVLIQLGFEGFESRGPQFYQPALNFVSLFGCISECYLGATFPEALGMFDLPLPFDPSRRSILAVSANRQDATGQVGIGPGSERGPHFLVRSVPEPAAPALLALLALVGLVLVRSRCSPQLLRFCEQDSSR